MFFCFGSSKKKESTNKKVKDKEMLSEGTSDKLKELEKESKKLKNEIHDLISDSESFRLQFYFIDETVNQYKKIIIDINNNLSESKVVEFILKTMSKENYDLKQKNESLNGNIKILRATLNELCAKIEELNDPFINKTQQIEYNNFILQNLFIKKENEILNLEKFLKNLKNYTKKSKKSNFEVEMHINNNGEVIPMIGLNSQDQNAIQNGIRQNPMNKEEEVVLRKILSEELDYSRGMYQKITKQTINQNTINYDNNKKIEEIRNEISYLKNPKPTLTQSNLSDVNSHFALNTMPSTLKEIKRVEKQNDKNKQKEKEYLQLNENMSSTLLSKKEEQLNKTLEEVTLKNNELQDLQIESDQFKKANDKLEVEISSLNNELSENFSLIFKLEMKLDKLKMKKKKRRVLNGNIQVSAKLPSNLDPIAEEEKKVII